MKTDKTKYILIIRIVILSVLLLSTFVICINKWLSADSLPNDAVVYIVPVYGQSLAIGEETVLVTDIDDYAKQTNHRIKSEFLNERIGYSHPGIFVRKIKSVIKWKRRHFESSIFGLGECFIKMQHNEKSILCTFTAGRGNTEIGGLKKGTKPYEDLINTIRYAYDKAKSQGAHIVVPAFCWLQGENDLVWNTKYNYCNELKQLRKDIENDVYSITRQKQSVKCILYQTNNLTLSQDTMKANMYYCRQVIVPEMQRQLICYDSNFCASGPVYPYNVARNYVHIDAYGQKQLGWMEGLSLCRLFKGERFVGLQPKDIIRHGDTLIVKMQVPSPPLVIDTITVSKTDYYGFSVINKDDNNILRHVKVDGTNIYLICEDLGDKINKKVKVRYGVNGMYMKSGRIFGPRGNLRDSQGLSLSCDIKGKRYPLDNWCYIFEKEY